jgi:hypothetical protein
MSIHGIWSLSWDRTLSQQVLSLFYLCLIFLFLCVYIHSIHLCLQVFDPTIQSGRGSTREIWAGPYFSIVSRPVGQGVYKWLSFSLSFCGECIFYFVCGMNVRIVTLGPSAYEDGAQNIGEVLPKFPLNRQTRVDQGTWASP